MINKYQYVLIFLLFNYTYSCAMAEGDAFFNKNEMDLPLVVKHVSQKRKIKREKKFKKNGDMLEKKYPQFYRMKGSMGIFTIVECIVQGRAKL